MGLTIISGKAAREMRDAARNKTRRMDLPLVNPMIYYIGHAKTPTGGIPAATVTGDNIQMGSAVCKIYTCNSTGYLTLTTMEITIFNEGYNDCAGDQRIIFHYNDAGLPVVNVEYCSG